MLQPLTINPACNWWRWWRWWIEEAIQLDNVVGNTIWNDAIDVEVMTTVKVTLHCLAFVWIDNVATDLLLHFMSLLLKQMTARMLKRGWLVIQICILKPSYENPKLWVQPLNVGGAMRHCMTCLLGKTFLTVCFCCHRLCLMLLQVLYWIWNEMMKLFENICVTTSAQ